MDVVCLMLPALHCAAGAGLLAAIDAAWPGGALLQRLKRSAARELAKAGLAGLERERSAGPLGAALCKYEPLAYAAVRGRGGGGLMAHLNEAASGGYLIYTKQYKTDGTLKLKLDALLLEFPANDGRDLGLPAPADAGTVPTHGSVTPVSRPSPAPTHQGAGKVSSHAGIPHAPQTAGAPGAQAPALANATMQQCNNSSRRAHAFVMIRV